MKYKGLSFEPLSEDNLDLITKIQNEIFPQESAAQNYIEALEKNPYRRELSNWLVFNGKKPIGVVGCYSYHEYPLTAWLGWFGVLKEERGKKFGSTIFHFWIDYAKRSGYTEARLYTDKVSNKDVLGFYKHEGMIEEEYLNTSESSEVTDTTLIFSLSLTDKSIEKWNDKFLELSEQLKKQN